MNPRPDLPLSLCSTFYQMMVSPLATRETATGTSPLLKLPPELRTIIFEPLIQAGDLSILRVSKLMNQEAVLLLNKVAILRLDISGSAIYQTETTIAVTAKIDLCGRLTLTGPDYIQNLDICLTVDRHCGLGLNTKFVKYFSGNQIARRSCNIKIFFGLTGPFPHPIHRSTNYKVIASLSGYRFLTLKLVHFVNETYEAAVLRSKNPLLMTDDPDSPYKWMGMGYKQVHKQISNFLEAYLGPAKLNDSLEGPYLSFEPRAFKPHPLAPKPPDVQVIYP